MFRKAYDSIKACYSLLLLHAATRVSTPGNPGGKNPGISRIRDFSFHGIEFALPGIFLGFKKDLGRFVKTAEK